MKLDDYEIARHILRSHPDQIANETLKDLVDGYNTDFCIEALKSRNLEFFKEHKISNRIEDIGIEALFKILKGSLGRRTHVAYSFR